MSNKRIWIDDLKPGMRLAVPIFYQGQVLADEDFVLTDKFVEQLKNRSGILTAVVKDDGYHRPLAEWEKAIMANYMKAVKHLKDVFEKARETRQVPMNEIVEIASDTVNSLVKESYILQTLKTLNNYDEYTYMHSINVGVLCGVLGKWLKYDKDTLFMMVLSGVLHDIGKSQIPIDILNKPDKLTDDELAIMKRHTVYGYEMLEDVFSIPEEVKMAVLQHHERIDGTGYPYAAKNGSISDFAKIVAVADTYDAVTSNRVYKKASSPFTLLDILEEEMFMRLDSKICLPMLSHIKDSLIGKYVVTEDGKRAEIIFIGKQTIDDMILKTEEGELVHLSMGDYKYFKDYAG